MTQQYPTKLDYHALIARYSWIIERNQNCILSPDSDGLLCGLLMSYYLGWRIRGFYDGKVLVIDEGVKPQDCVFLDMEIFRPNIRSVGQHMVMYDKEDLPKNWNNFVFFSVFKSCNICMLDYALTFLTSRSSRPQKARRLSYSL